MTAANIINGSGSNPLFQKVYASLIDGDNNINSQSNPIYVSGAGGIPANKAIDAYAYQAYSQTATYGYTFKEDGNGNWYIARETLATGVFDYAKGTGGYTSVYVNATSDPSGTPTWGTYDQIFDNVGASSLSFDVDGNLKVSQPHVEATNIHTSNIELRTFQENHICTANTTTTPLGANATFTGDWQDCLNYAEVNVSIISNQNSATNGLVFQWSADGTNIGDTDSYSYYTATGGTNYTPNPAFRYVRIIYTNGASAQASFSLQTILRRQMTGGSFHRIDSTLKDDSDARLNITVPKLKTAQNTYVSQTATTAGNAKVSIEELETGISDNTKTQLKTSCYMKTGDSTFQVPRLDAQTHVIETIDYAHHEIHAGSSFSTCYTADIGNGANMDVMLITPDTTKWAHMTYEFEGEAEFDFNIYEAPTTTANGTALDIYNRDRNSASAATVTAFHTPTVTSVGTTRIRCWHAGSGRQIGGGDRGTHEFILKQNTKYLFRITNATTNNNYMSLKIDWYEHTNRSA